MGLNLFDHLLYVFQAKMRCKTNRRRGRIILLYLVIFVLVLEFYRHAGHHCFSMNAAYSFDYLRSLTETNSTSVRGSSYKNASASIMKLIHTSSTTKRNPRYYSYVIENKNVCAVVAGINVMVLVHSSTDHFSKRKLIRSTTLGNKTLSEVYKLRLVFVLGKPKTRTNQALIESESERFGDIVQGNFIDTYRNLTHNALLGFQWVLEHCNNATFIMKIDDDVLVDTAGVISLMSTKYADVKRTIMCRVKWNGTDPILREGKWPVSLTDYPIKYWPVTHCAGVVMFFTGDIITELYSAASRIPFLWIDDVYVPGFLAAAVGNITHYKPQDILRLVTLTGVHLR